MSRLDAEKVPGALVAAAILGGLFAAFQPSSEADPGRRETARAIPILGAAAPFLVVVVVSSFPQPAISPVFLVLYLLAVAAGAWIASLRTGFALLTPLAAGLCMGALIARTA